MPELPEVEVIRRGLAPKLLGRRFLGVTAGDKRLRQQSSPEQLRRWLSGRHIEKLRRQGKYLLFDLEADSLEMHNLSQNHKINAEMLQAFEALMNQTIKRRPANLQKSTVDLGDDQVTQRLRGLGYLD